MEGFFRAYRANLSAIAKRNQTGGGRWSNLSDAGEFAGSLGWGGTFCSVVQMGFDVAYSLGAINQLFN